MPQSPSQIFVGIGKQASRGTPVTPDYFPPVRSPEFTPMQTMLEDKGLRGSMVDVYGLQQGLRHDEVGWSGDVFLDSIPRLIQAILGSDDTKTGTAAPVTHAFSLQNTVVSGETQPPALTAVLWDGHGYRQFEDLQGDSLGFKFNAANLLEYDFKALASPFTLVAAPTQTLTGLKPVPAWDASVTVNGVASTKLIDGSIDLKRGTKAIETAQGSQTPYRLWAGPLSVGGKITLVREDDTELNLFLNNTQGSLDFTFTDPSTPTTSIKFHMTTAAFKAGKPTYGKDWIEQELEFVGVPNATDATSGGVSPVKVTITNAVTTAY